MRCISCGYFNDYFDISVVGIRDGAFVFQSKCPACGSLKVVFSAGEFEEQQRLLTAKKEEGACIRGRW